MIIIINSVDQHQGTRVCTVGSGESDVNWVRVCYLVRHLLKGGGSLVKIDNIIHCVSKKMIGVGIGRLVSKKTFQRNYVSAGGTLGGTLKC